jgi:hypothetical protein
MGMRNGIRWGGLVVAAMVTGSVGFADDKAKKADVSPEEMMKKMEVAGRPGAEHKALEALVGDWNTEVKMWNDPKSAPSVTKGSAKSVWALNGRFVQEEFQGEFMGKPFRGLSFTGYDNAKKKFNSVWMDDMHTSMFNSEGDSEAGHKVITLNGTFHCPITDEKNKPMKQVIRIVSRDKHVLEMYEPDEGNRKTMEVTYTRK